MSDLRIEVSGLSKGGRSDAVDRAAERLRNALPSAVVQPLSGAPARAIVRSTAAPYVNDGWFRRVLSGLTVEVRYAQTLGDGSRLASALSIGSAGSAGGVAATVQDFFGGVLGGIGDAIDPRRTVANLRTAAGAVLPDDPFGIEGTASSLSTAAWVAVAIGGALVLALLGLALWQIFGGG